MFFFWFLIIAACIIILFLRKSISLTDRHYIIFFHPECDGLGGGEKVLWSAIGGIQARFKSSKQMPQTQIFIITVSNKSLDDMMSEARKR
jgi:hypothetical protein